MLIKFVSVSLQLILLVIAEGQWNPPCIGDDNHDTGCSISDKDGKTIIYCEYESTDEICETQLDGDQVGLPSEPKNLGVNTYLAEYPAFGKYPGFNVTWNLDPATAQYLKGFQVFMLGLSVGSDFEKKLCHTFNLSQTDFSQQIFTDNPELSFFYDNCLRSLNPGDQYEIVVRSLPYDPIENNEVRSIYTIPGCSHTNMKEAARCLQLDGDEPALWLPSHLSLTPGYSLVNVSFDLAPPEYGFNQYYVGLYQCPDTSDVNKCISVNGWEPTLLLPFANDSNKIYNTTINRIPVESMIFTVLYDIPVGKTYHVGITPWPEPNTCNNPLSGNPISCSTTISYAFIAIDNPCNSSPCRNVGICVPDPIEIEKYNCELSESDQSDQSGNQGLFIGIGIGILCALLVIIGLILMLHWLYVGKRTDLTASGEKPHHTFGNETASSKLDPSVLVIYSHDCPLYIEVVDCLCAFLQSSLGCRMIFDQWPQGKDDGNTFPERLCRQMASPNVSRILFIASRGTRNRLQPDDTKLLPITNLKFPDLVGPALTYITGDLADRRSERRKKYITVFFDDFSDYSDIPDVPFLRNPGSSFRLPSEMEKFYRKLTNLPRLSPNSPKITFKIADNDELWKKFKDKISEMEKYAREDPDWYLKSSDVHPDLDFSGHPSLGGRRESQEAACEFTYIPEPDTLVRSSFDQEERGYPSDLSSGYDSGGGLVRFIAEGGDGDVEQDNASLGSDFQEFNQSNPVINQDLLDHVPQPLIAAEVVPYVELVSGPRRVINDFKIVGQSARKTHNC